MTLALRCLVLVLALVASASPAVFARPVAAQQTALPDEAKWLAVVGRAEDTIARAQASDDALEDLRRELIDWRRTLTDATKINDTRIRTVQAQIDALGPAPEEGETEPEDIVQLREDLTAQLAELRAPGRTAEVALNRANALIAEIDQILRDRQTRKLLQRDPSPLNPSAWSLAWTELRRADTRFLNEIERTLAGPAQRALLRERLPFAAILLVVGVMLIFLGRRLVEWLTRRISRSRSDAAGDLAAFVLSLGQILVPAIGLLAIYIAGSVTIADGTMGVALLGSIVLAGLIVILGRWIGLKLFPEDDGAFVLMQMPQEDRAKARTYTLSLAVILGAKTLLDVLGDPAGLSDVVRGLLVTPLVVLASLIFWRLGTLLRSWANDTFAEAGATEGVEAGFLPGVVWILGRALVLVAILAPATVFVGYYNLAEFMVFPTISSLGLIALIGILHVVIRNVYSLVTKRNRDETSDALVPVLLTLLVGIAAIPEFALLWGARWTDISEAWDWLKTGFQLGDARIGLDTILTMIVVFTIGYGLTSLLQATLKTAVLPRTKLDAGGRSAITAGVGYVGITLALIAAITIAGVDLTGLALLASALSVGIGFGLQTIVSNFVSGLIILVERPISEGDWIEVNTHMGIVKDISVRSTTIQTFDRTDVIVPNADLIAGVVTNWTKNNTIGRVIVSVGVAYSCDSKRVEEILREECEAHPLVSMNPPPAIFFRRFGADSLEFDCFCILRDVNFKLVVHSELNHAIHARFRDEGIEIPFSQRDVWLRNPEVLQGPVPSGIPAKEDGEEAPEPA